MDDSKEIHISNKKVNKWYVITIKGEFIVRNLLKIKNRFEEAERRHENFLAIDLSSTTYIDSSAVTILLNFYKRCTENGGTLILVSLHPDIKEIISILGVDKVIATYSSIKEVS